MTTATQTVSDDEAEIRLDRWFRRHFPGVPQSAIHDDGGKKVVFLVQDDKLERRAVTVGNNRGSDAEITAGLAIGDTVVVSGPGDLRDGQSVSVKK